jgi:hypothetical protein
MEAPCRIVDAVCDLDEQHKVVRAKVQPVIRPSEIKAALLDGGRPIRRDGVEYVMAYRSFRAKERSCGARSLFMAGM